MRASIHAFVEQRLADPGLGPDMIAAAHHFPAGICTRCSGPGPTERAWQPGSGIGGSSAASAICWTFRAALRVPPARYRTLHSKE